MNATKLSFGIPLVLLSMAVWAQSSNNQQNAGTATGSSNPVTIRGCLTGAAGTYVLLADEKGTPYKLRASNDLDRLIKHEVEVTGQVLSPVGTDRSQTSSGDNGRTHVPPATLQVSSVRDVADTCAVKPRP